MEREFKGNARISDPNKLFLTQEAEFQMKVSELEEDIRFREQTIRTLEEEMKALQSGVTNMAQELEAKGKEVLRVRSDARKAMK